MGVSGARGWRKEKQVLFLLPSPDPWPPSPAFLVDNERRFDYIALSLLKFFVEHIFDGAL
jgi:hypothetical protein